MKNKKKLFVTLFFLLFSGFCFSQTLDLSVIVEPKIIDSVSPSYPQRQLRNAEEGWVELNFMVDTNGKIFEPVVVNSMGDESFHARAITALESSTFSPGIFDGEPVIASSRYIYSFVIGNKISGDRLGGARPSFSRKIKKFMVNVEEGEQDEIQLLFDDLNSFGAKNFYEDAYINWARYRFAKRFGTELEQLNYLSRALVEVEEGRYLSREMVREGMRDRFRLEVATKRLREATVTYGEFIEMDDTEAIESYKVTYEMLWAYEHNDDGYGVGVILNDYGSWSFYLHKHNVYFDQVEGKVDEMKLYCNNKFATLPVDIELTYNIPDAWGACSLHLVGSPGASLVLVQH